MPCSMSSEEGIIVKALYLFIYLHYFIYYLQICYFYLLNRCTHAFIYYLQNYVFLFRKTYNGRFQAGGRTKLLEREGVCYSKGIHNCTARGRSLLQLRYTQLYSQGKESVIAKVYTTVQLGKGVCYS